MGKTTAGVLLVVALAASVLTLARPADASGEIDAYYATLGGSGGFLGPSTGTEHEVCGGPGRVHTYQNGNIYWKQATGAHEVHGGILIRLLQNNGLCQGARFPTGNNFGPDTLDLGSSCGDARHGTASFFQNGVIYANDHGNFWIHGAILDHYLNDLGGSCTYGRPISDNINPRNGRDFALFISNGGEEGAIIDKTNRSGPNAAEVHGAIFAAMIDDAGGPSSLPFDERAQRALASFGPPTGDEAITACHGSTGGVFNRFHFRDVVWGPSTGGAHVLFDSNGGGEKFRSKWVALDSDCGVLGLPTSNLSGPGNPVLGQDFQHGVLVFNGSKTVEVHGEVLDLWNAEGRNFVGVPQTDVTPDAHGGYFSHFSKGSIYYGSAYIDATAVLGKHDGEYRGSGGPDGTLGYPLFETGHVTDGQLFGGDASTGDPYNGTLTTFEHGYIASNRWTKPGIIINAFATKWHNESNEQHADTGYPQGGPIVDHGGVTFQIFRTLHPPVGTDSDTWYVLNPHDAHVYRVAFHALDCYRRGPGQDRGDWDGVMGFPTGDQYIDSGPGGGEVIPTEFGPGGAPNGYVFFHHGGCHYGNF